MSAAAASATRATSGRNILYVSEVMAYERPGRSWTISISMPTARCVTRQDHGTGLT
jgi:hypothetical protein